jgi:hypothetical protein
MSITLILIGIGVALGIVFAIEDSRDWVIEQLESGWEAVEEIFSGAFEDMGELSYMGVAFAILAVGVIYCTRYINLDGSGMGSIEAMLQYMKPVSRIVWTVISYVAVAVGGYFVGKGFENS